MTPIYDQLCAERGIKSHRTPRRFRIYRIPNLTDYAVRTPRVRPWVLLDRENPANTVRFAGMEEAVAGMDGRLRAERATA